MIVVVGESGEYESRYQSVLGVFATLAEAEAAVEAARARSPEKWRLFCDWDARRKKALESFAPVNTITSTAFPMGVHRVYSNEQYARAEALAGEKPEFGFQWDRLFFFETAPGDMADSGLEPVKEIRC